MSAVVRCNAVSKSYLRGGALNVKEMLVGKHRSLGRFLREWALQDVSFEVERGEGFGVVGPNGSGKSTLLAVIVGVLRADRGSVAVSARVAPLLELGSGFHPELTGRQNVMLYASILGMRMREIRKVFEQIVEFSELEAAIDNPLRTYSSGMITRLGFSTIIHAPADLLVVDEVLAVGDIEFREKCRMFLKGFRARGGTLVVVSHDVQTVQAICESGICLNEGRVIAAGRSADVLTAYRNLEQEHAGPRALNAVKTS